MTSFAEEDPRVEELPDSDDDDAPPALAGDKAAAEDAEEV